MGGGGIVTARYTNKITLWNSYNADSQSLAPLPPKKKPNKHKLGEKAGHTNLHENAAKSSLKPCGDSFYCKVLLLVNVPLVREAEPGGVVGETIVWLFFPP